MYFRKKIHLYFWGLKKFYGRSFFGNYSFFLLLLGIMFIITGYTHQVTPSCDKGVRLKLVNISPFITINVFFISNYLFALC